MRLLEHPAVILILILLIVILFGARRLPDVARSLGRSGRILKSEVDEMKSDHSSKAEPIEKADPIDSAEPMDSIRRRRDV